MDKYQYRIFEGSDDAKEPQESIAVRMMPQKVVTGEFLLEGTKKKVYLQLLANHLYYFRSNKDSYSFEHYDVTMLQTNLTHSNIDNGEVVLMLNTEKDTLFRLRSPDNFEYLLDWAHAIRRATTYYQSQDGIASLQKKQPVTKAKEKFGLEEVENGACKVLGYASKKGGGVRGFKRRWWVLDSHYLYYFKDDIRKSKKQGSRGRNGTRLCGPDGCRHHVGFEENRQIRWVFNRDA